jgi:hypothetical protein
MRACLKNEKKLFSHCTSTKNVRWGPNAASSGSGLPAQLAARSAFVAAVPACCAPLRQLSVRTRADRRLLLFPQNF